MLDWKTKNLQLAGNPTMEPEFFEKTVLAPAVQDIDLFKISSITPTTQPNEILVKFEKAFKNHQIRPFSVTAKLRRTGNQWRVVSDIEYFNGGVTSMRLPFTGSF